jgi:hypothetical protein
LRAGRRPGEDIHLVHGPGTVRVRHHAATRAPGAPRDAREIVSPRIVKVERYGRICGNYLRVVEPDDLDEEVAVWIAESYAHGAAGG